MRSLVILGFVLSGALGITGSLAFTPHPSDGRATVRAFRASLRVPARPRLERPQPALGAPQPELCSTFAGLPSLRFYNQNTGERAEVRLYDDAGHVNEAEALRLDALLGDTRDPKQPATLRLDRRTLQLAVRAALHFGSHEVQVVSAYRKPGSRREGPHASGKAIDFKLPSVPARLLAAYLRTLPRVGVGIYTHPKTAFVHLDDREHSFHWLDASPPGRHWRERSLGGAGLGRLDAHYTPAVDWPEGMTAPADAPL